jgi:hypothetical protein
MRCAWLLLALAACSFDASEDAIWRGTIKRDGGAPLPFAGFDPYPAQGYAFGGGMSSMGYLDDGDQKVLVSLQLHFTDRHDFENAKSQAFPIAIPITDASNVAGIGIDVFEQAASETGGPAMMHVFHHDYAQHETNTSSGTLTVTASDYKTFIDGHLSATVMDNDRGTTRYLELDVHYNGQK